MAMIVYVARDGLAMLSLSIARRGNWDAVAAALSLSQQHALDVRHVVWYGWHCRRPHRAPNTRRCAGWALPIAGDATGSPDVLHWARAGGFLLNFLHFGAVGLSSYPHL
jgi:hypothetical protein